jgi:ribokinase
MDEHKPTILAVGAAVQDVFLRGDVFKPVKEDDGELVEEFPLGSKQDVEEIIFSTGGGATNGCVTFSRQGLNAIFMGQIGRDPAGVAVLEDLKADHVDSSMVQYSEKHNTGYSVLLLAPSGERTILTYRGASTHYEENVFSLDGVDADWLFVTSLAGNIKLLEKLVNEAKAKNMKVAMIPGKGELKQGDKLKELMHKVDLVSMNKEELQMLVEGDDDIQLVRHASDMTPIVVMTDGPRGVTATDRKQIVKAGMYEDVPVIDRTGAGDAFASGLVASIAKGHDLKQAIVFASANSTNVVNNIGAKTGILHEGYELHDMPLEVSDF